MILTHFYKIFIVFSLFWLTSIGASAQVVQKFGVNTNSITDKAVLELESTSKGFLLPRMTRTQMEAISITDETPESLIVICTDCSTTGSEVQIYTNSSWRGLLTNNLDLDLTANHVLVGNAANKAEIREISGDITLDNEGASTIGESKVLSSMILNDEIVDADVNNDAAILGTKIKPNFGIQDVSTQGTLDAGATTVTTLTSVGTLGAVGAVDFDSTLNVDGTTTLDDATVTGALKVTGDTAADFTQIPTAPTADPGTNTTQLATTAFVIAQQSESYSSIEAFEKISTTSDSDVKIDGMTISPNLGTYTVLFNAQYSFSPANSSNEVSTEQALEDLRTIYNEINALTEDSYKTSAETIENKTFTPGVYYWEGALTMQGPITFDAEGKDNPYFVIKTGAALTSESTVNVQLLNGARASNIYWVAEGAITIHKCVQIPGTFLSQNGAIVSTADKINGRLLTLGGKITFGPGTIEAPADSPSFINFRTANTFVLLTEAGDLHNQDYSTYKGDLATGTGTMIGFDNEGPEDTGNNDHTIGGTIYAQKTVGSSGNIVYEKDGNITFSFYKKTETETAIIPHSSRMVTTETNTANISLQAITTFENNDEIQVKWNTDTGTLSVENRILTLIKIQ